MESNLSSQHSGQDSCTEGAGQPTRLLDQGGKSVLIAGVESCGAAARGWPTASAVGLGIENLSREAAKESPPGPNSVAPDRAFREGAWFPTAHAVGYHLPPLRGGHIELRLSKF